jgi:hypothetical protein
MIQDCAKIEVIRHGNDVPESRKNFLLDRINAIISEPWRTTRLVWSRSISPFYGHFGAPAPAELSDKERAVLDALMMDAKKGNAAYFTMMTARPQTVGYGATDCPAGLAAWMLGILVSRNGLMAPIPASRRPETTCLTISRCTG